ncbi:MAG: type I restriction enzyme HsdR N-terminal domain-containing protein, partial [Sinomicrobium sp.]|nr:type I restriction enzyme HsdR N-terminal domain-containing protein [Sinomicrobium sp.]
MGRTLSEADVRSLCIDPALEKAGWDGRKQIRREVTFTAGKILVKGKVAQRGTKKRADYILYHSPTIPIAIIEAKDSRHAVSDGIQQALEYA